MLLYLIKLFYQALMKGLTRFDLSRQQQDSCFEAVSKHSQAARALKYGPRGTRISHVG